MVVEGREMNTMNTTPGFGRRVVQSDGRDLALIPDAPVQGLRANLTGQADLKERVRSALMQRIDPAVAGRIPRRRLQAEVALLVSAIATEEKVQLNEIEESVLAVELTDDMVFRQEPSPGRLGLSDFTELGERFPRTEALPTRAGTAPLLEHRRNR
jgi:hypothetical protein